MRLALPRDRPGPSHDAAARRRAGDGGAGPARAARARRGREPDVGRPRRRAGAGVAGAGRPGRRATTTTSWCAGAGAADADRPAWAAPPSGRPARSCRASPATRSPTPACSASTPAPRSASCVAIACLGISSVQRLRLVRLRRRRRRRRRRVRRRLARLGGRHAGEARAGRRRRSPPSRTSLITLVLLADQHTLDEFRFWQVGSLGHRTSTSSTPWCRSCCRSWWSAWCWRSPPAGCSTRSRSATTSPAGSGRTSSGAGCSWWWRSCCSAGRRSSLVGPIAFVGLVVPHVARGAGRARLPLDRARSRSLLGPVLLLAADVVGRLLVPGELEAGLVVALVGAPVLLVDRAAVAGGSRHEHPDGRAPAGSCRRGRAGAAGAGGSS